MMRGLRRPDACECFDAGLVQRASQAVSKLNYRFPSKQLSRQRNVRLANFRIIRGQCLVHDLRSRPGHLDHRLGQFEQRELVRIADVHRPVHTRLRQPDISLARELLGWEPTVELREGLQRTLDAAGTAALTGTHPA